MNYLTASQILKRTDNLALLDNQKDYREQLAAFIRMHTMRCRSIASGVNPATLPTVSMLLIASTGSGKTFVTSRLAEAAGVSVISVDCSCLSREGWKGVNLGNLIHNEYMRIGDKEAFETSIIFFDEFDKVRLHFGEHDSGNPQVNFLHLFDGSISSDLGRGETFTANTSRMSFVFCGAFDGLEDVINKRATPRSMGFSGNVEKSGTRDALAKVTVDDLTRYGIMRELVGRIGYITHIPKLSEKDYHTLIIGENCSIRDRYNNLFGVIPVDVDISDDACHHLASMAGNDDLGARAITPLVNRYFLRSILDVETDTRINKIVLDYTDDDGLHTDFEYGERVRRKFTGAKNRKSVLMKTAPRVPDFNFTYILRTVPGVRDTVKMFLNVFDFKELKGRTLFQAYLYCALTYLKYNCNEDDHNLGSLVKLVRLVNANGNGTFNCMVNRVLDNQITYGSDQLQKSYDKLMTVLSHDPDVERLVTNMKAVRMEWYDSLARSVS